MTAPTRPQGPAPRRLPRRVYWVRRFVVLAVVAVVAGTVLGLTRALVGAWSGDAERDVATPASAEVTVTPTGGRSAAPSSTPSATSAATPLAEPSGTEDRRPSGEDEQPLPEPEGVCEDSDVVVTPQVHDARLDEPIRIVLGVSTRTTPACTWEVGPDSVFLKITRLTPESEEVVWSSQQCPGLVPTAQVVARQQQAAEVVVSWDGRKSDADCSKVSGWVHAGEFRAVSVARGAVTPQEVEFPIGHPRPRIVVEPPPPPKHGRGDEERNSRDDSSDGPGDGPGAGPSEGR